MDPMRIILGQSFDKFGAFMKLIDITPIWKTQQFTTENYLMVSTHLKNMSQIGSFP